MKLASLRPHVALWGLRAAWALAVALWALALVPWFRTPPPQPLTQGAVPGATPRSAVTASQPGRELPNEEVIEPSEAIQAAAQPRGASAIEVAAVPPERGARDSAVCGLADAGGPGDAPSPALRASHFARQASLGLLQAFEALRTRGEAPPQAAGWWLRVLMAREGAAEASPTGPACAPGSDCAAATTTLPPVAAAVDALAQLAQASNDAWVQQIAQRACDGPPPTSAVCLSLGTRRWSGQEPDNAAAWFELAARDAQAADEALFRAAKASRFDGHRGRLAAWVLQASPEALPAMQRYAAWQRSDELERAADARALAAAARACSEAARRDANRDQLCDGAARWLTQTSRAPAAAETTAATSRALDCATIERQWREARDSAQRGARVATSGAGR